MIGADPLNNTVRKLLDFLGKIVRHDPCSAEAAVFQLHITSAVVEIGLSGEMIGGYQFFHTVP